MTTSPVTSVTDELIADIQREFDRNGPCPHFNSNPLGAGHWVHCDDCNQNVGVEYLETAKAASEKHDDLSLALRALLAERAEFKRDAARYRWLIRQAWFQSAMDRYDIDDGGMQARFEAETARIIDAAMQS